MKVYYWYHRAVNAALVLCGLWFMMVGPSPMALCFFTLAIAHTVLAILRVLVDLLIKVSGVNHERKDNAAPRPDTAPKPTARSDEATHWLTGKGQ